MSKNSKKKNRNKGESNLLVQARTFIASQKYSEAMIVLERFSQIENKSSEEIAFISKQLNEVLELSHQVIVHVSSMFEVREKARSLAKTIHYAHAVAYMNLLKKSYDPHFHQLLEMSVASIELYDEQSKRERVQQLRENTVTLLDEMLLEAHKKIQHAKQEVKETLDAIIESVKKKNKKEGRENRKKEKGEKEVVLLREAQKALTTKLTIKHYLYEGKQALAQGDEKKEENINEAIEYYNKGKKCFSDALKEDHQSSDAYFGLMKTYRRLGDAVSTTSRVMIEALPPGSVSLSRMIIVRADQQKNYYTKANTYCETAMSLLKESPLLSELCCEIAHLKELMGDYSASACYYQQVFSGFSDKFYEHYLDLARDSFLKMHAQAIYRYQYILHSQDFRQYLERQYSLSKVACLHMYSGAVYVDLQQYNAAIQQYLLALIYNETLEQNELTYEDLQKNQKYLNETVFKNIFGLTNPEELRNIRMAYGIWIKFDLEKKNYLDAAKKMLIADNEDLFLGVLQKEMVDSLNIAFAQLLKESLSSKMYMSAAKIILMREFESFSLDLLDKNDLSELVSACAQEIRVYLDQKNYKIASKKFIMASASELITDVFLVDSKFWYEMGLACTVTKCFDTALFCFAEVDKFEHAYVDLEQRKQKASALKVKQEQGEEIDRCARNFYGVNGSSIMFNMNAATYTMTEKGRGCSRGAVPNGLN